MRVTRRDFLKTSGVLAGALALARAGLLRDQFALAAEGALPVVWLQAQACSGCSVSLLNSVSLMTAASLFTKEIALAYHPTLMAAAGDQAVAAAKTATTAAGGFVLVVEGAVPTGSDGEYCYVWPGMTAQEAVTTYAPAAKCVVAVGTCAAFGGVCAGRPNPTGARGVSALAGRTPVVNIPGCPAHPDWIVGTVSRILAEGKAPPLDPSLRPTDYFRTKVHDACPNLAEFTKQYAKRMRHAREKACLTCHTSADARHVKGPRALGTSGCLFALNCKGRFTSADCPTRKWNAGAPGGTGVNWCVEGGAPCQGCTEPGFPDAMSPFFRLNGPGIENH